jgi:hypothetical protein
VDVYLVVAAQPAVLVGPEEREEDAAGLAGGDGNVGEGAGAADDVGVEAGLGGPVVGGVGDGETGCVHDAERAALAYCRDGAADLEDSETVADGAVGFGDGVTLLDDGDAVEDFAVGDGAEELRYSACAQTRGWAEPAERPK